MCSPEGVAVDTLGNVYIADTQDSRVLEYNTPFNAASGETGAGDTNADLVFGQTAASRILPKTKAPTPATYTAWGRTA